MTPNQLAKSGTEHAHQTALFAYTAVAYRHGWAVADAWAEEGPTAFKASTYKAGEAPAVPALEWFHAIPNGGSRGDDDKSRKIRGGQLKAEGVRQGVADTFLPWPVYEPCPSDPQLMVVKWCGLYIEMKKPTQKPKREGSKGGLSEDQIEFGEYAKKVGFGFVVCYSWKEAVEVLKAYVNWQR